jgi:fibronectin-binding autotransporter adhesin
MNSQSIHSRRLKLIASLLLPSLPLVIGVANAQTWDAGGGATTNINTPANWNGDTLPLFDGSESLTFATTGTTNTTATLNAPVSLLGLTFSGDANFTINGAQPLSIGTGGITTDATATALTAARTQTISGPVTLTGNQSWTANNGAFADNLTVSGNITGAFSITKLGAATLTLSGNNNSTWTGSSGVGLILGNASTVNLQGSNTTIPNVLGTGAVQFNAAGTLTVNGGNSFTLANNFIINSTTNSTGFTPGANINFAGGAQPGSVVTLSGSFSRAALNTNTGSLQFSANVSTPSEGRFNLTGDFSGLGTTNSIILSSAGTVQIDALQAVAPSTVQYVLNAAGANTTNKSAKLIFNLATTVNNAITFGNNTAASNANSVGTIVAANQTTTLAGAINNSSTNGANFFAQNTGSVLDITGQLSAGAGVYNINNQYSYITTPGSVQVLVTPTGTVKLSRPTGNVATSDLTVFNGTLLANNTSGSAFRGNGTVNSGATLGGTGFIVPDAGKTLTINGNIAAGDGGIGTLTLSGANTALAVATFNTGATFSFDLGAGLTSDRLALTGGAAGDFVFNNNVINFTDLTGGSLATGAYTLFTASNANNYNGLTISGTAITGGLTIGTGLGGYTADLALVGSDIVVNVSAIPEPSTFGTLAGVTILGFAAMRRRRVS